MARLLRYKINSQINIEASPKEVWKVFGDFGHWGDWNRFCHFEAPAFAESKGRSGGQPVVPEKVGKRCHAVFNLAGGCIRQSVHHPEVLVLDEGHELRWKDDRGLPLSLFFRGSHWWVLEPLPNGHTCLIHGAEMMGLALPFLQPTMWATARGYDAFNKALRQEVLARQQQQTQKGQQC